MRRPPNLGQVAIAVGQIALSAGDLAVEYANSKKLANLQANFKRILDSDAAKIDYANDLAQRIQIAATTLAHSGQIQPGTPLFDQYLGLIVKPDMQYNGNCNVGFYQPAAPYDQTNAPKSLWITIDRNGFVQPSGNAPPDVGSIWSSGCQEAENQAGIEYVNALKGTQISGGLWTGIRGKIQQLTRSDVGTVDLFMRIGLGVFVIAGLILVLKVQGALIEEQEGVRYVRKLKGPPPPPRTFATPPRPMMRPAPPMPRAPMKMPGSRKSRHRQSKKK